MTQNKYYVTVILQGESEMAISVKQYLEIFEFSTVENLRHIKRVLMLSNTRSEDLHNRYEAVKIALGESK